nr:MAG TPA: hypothetical protein [Caudoviricetes sp.]
MVSREIGRFSYIQARGAHLLYTPVSPSTRGRRYYSLLFLS